MALDRSAFKAAVGSYRLSARVTMNHLKLTDSEITQIKQQLACVMTSYSSVEAPEFLNNSAVIAHEIPSRIRAFLNCFKQLEPPSGVCLVTGYPINEAAIGRTPAHWRDRPEVSAVLEIELLFVLLASLLGDVIGWATQQEGNLIHDVMPIREDEYSQIGTGSQQLIWWHNEDAFHPYRGDYVGLMCLRNPDHVATTFASVDMLRLDRCHVGTLFEPRFNIRPDNSHHIDNGNRHSGNGSARVSSGRERNAMIECFRKPGKIAVMSGDPASPYLRLDPYFMDPAEDDEAQRALNDLICEIDSKLSEVVLNPGDILFVDNYKAVHGRMPFKARYDGTDRWLKRINVTRDLRRSRGSRSSCTSRVIR